MSFDFFCGETEEPPGRFLKTVANGFDIGLVDEPSHEECVRPAAQALTVATELRATLTQAVLTSSYTNLRSSHAVPSRPSRSPSHTAAPSLRGVQKRRFQVAAAGAAPKIRVEAPRPASQGSAACPRPHGSRAWGAGGAWHAPGGRPGIPESRAGRSNRGDWG